MDDKETKPSDNGKDKRITVEVKDESGKSAKLAVRLSSRIEDLKEMIFDMWDVPVKSQVLTFRSEVLDDRCSVRHYDIKNGDCIQLTRETDRKDFDMTNKIVTSKHTMPFGGAISFIFLPTPIEKDKCSSFEITVGDHGCVHPSQPNNPTDDGVVAASPTHTTKAELLANEMTTQLENATTKRRMRSLKEKLLTRAMRRKKGSASPNTSPQSSRRSPKVSDDRSFSVDHLTSRIGRNIFFSDTSCSYVEPTCQCPTFLSGVFEQALIDQLDSDDVKRFIINNRRKRYELADAKCSPETKSLPVSTKAYKNVTSRVCDRQRCPQRIKNKCRRRVREQRDDNDAQDATAASAETSGRPLAVRHAATPSSGPPPTCASKASPTNNSSPNVQSEDKGRRHNDN